MKNKQHQQINQNVPNKTKSKTGAIFNQKKNTPNKKIIELKRRKIQMWTKMLKQNKSARTLAPTKVLHTQQFTGTKAQNSIWQQ